MSNVWVIRIGGAFLIGGALAFMGVFAFLAAHLNYPEVLDGSASEVLPNLLGTGATGRAVPQSTNYLLPLWMIIFGVALIRHRPDDLRTVDSLTG
jgi:hypothetical protein